VTTLGELTASIGAADRVAHVAQALTELAQALACPKQQRLRIVPGLWLDQRAKIIEQTRIRLAQRLATATGPADPPARNSAGPCPIVLRAMAVARITALTPPGPAVFASTAANRRMADSSITPKRYSLVTREGIPPSRKIRSVRFTCSRTGP
jgi:hypothetical protein